jgi:hypothetical protein
MIDSRQGYLAGAQPLVVSDSANSTRLLRRTRTVLPGIRKASLHGRPSLEHTCAVPSEVLCDDSALWPALPTSDDKRTPTSQVDGS